MTAREEILSRIRTALEVAPVGPATSHARIEKNYERTGKLDRAACLHFFIDRLVDYDTEIIEVTNESEISSAIAKALQNAQETTALIAPEFSKAWLPGSATFKVDFDLSIHEIEGTPAVVTTCEAAVATSGTIILVHEGAQARRVLTLLPDHHICLVRRNQVFELVPEALTAIQVKATKPITTISGPSATSDIEMTRIRGVHGPRRLTAILYGEI